MPLSPDHLGHHSESMNVGSPMSPTSPLAAGHQSQFLPSFLLGDSISHSPVSRLWSSASHSPPKSVHRPSSLTSPNSSGLITGTPRLDSGMKGKDKGGAPPIKSLLHGTHPAHGASSPYSTPAQTPFSRPSSHTPGISTPAPPTIGLSQSIQDSMYTPDHSMHHPAHLPTSPAQLDPFYTQGDSLTSDDVLDETWVTVFGFPPAAVSFVLQQFSQYGNILKHVISTDGNWMHLHYQSKIQAKKALSKNGKVLGNSIMVGVTPCIDKKVMEIDKENDILSSSGAQFATPGTSVMSPQVGGVKKTPIRPLTAAYKAARSENEVLQNNKAPRKDGGFVSKAMEYMFGW